MSRSRAAERTASGWMVSRPASGSARRLWSRLLSGWRSTRNGAAEGAVAGGIGRAEDADDRFAEGAGEMERAGVSGDHEGGAAGEGDEFAEAGLDGQSGTAAGLNYFGGKRAFGLAGVDHDRAALLRERCSDLAVPGGGPLLGAPAGAGIHEHHGTADSRGHKAAGPLLGAGIAGEVRQQNRQGLMADRTRNLEGLFDDVDAAGGDAFAEEPTGGVFSRLVFANHSSGSSPAANHSGADGALEVEADIVVDFAEVVAQALDLLQGLAAKGLAAPLFGGDQVQPVHQRHVRAGDAGSGLAGGDGFGAVLGAEQRAPMRFDGPPEHPVGMLAAERSDGR